MAETIGRCRRGGNRSARRKAPTTSLRKCYILKPENSSPSRDSNTHCSIYSRRLPRKLTGSPIYQSSRCRNKSVYLRCSELHSILTSAPVYCLKTKNEKTSALSRVPPSVRVSELLVLLLSFRWLRNDLKQLKCVAWSSS